MDSGQWTVVAVGGKTQISKEYEESEVCNMAFQHPLPPDFLPSSKNRSKVRYVILDDESELCNNGTDNINEESNILIERLGVFWNVIMELENTTHNRIRCDNVSSSSFSSRLVRCLWKFGRLWKSGKRESPLIPMMNALPHLHFPEDSVLDYYQAGCRMGSLPVLYVRKMEEARLPNNAEICLGASMPEIKELCSYIQADCSPEGAWELVLLMELGQQFNLVWLADDKVHRIIYDMDEFLAGKYFGKEGKFIYINALSNDDIKELLSWDVAPKVTIEGNVALVDYCVFSLHHAFYLVQEKIQFRPELKRVETILKKRLLYDCWINCEVF